MNPYDLPDGNFSTSATRNLLFLQKMFFNVRVVSGDRCITALLPASLVLLDANRGVLHVPIADQGAPDVLLQTYMEILHFCLG